MSRVMTDEERYQAEIAEEERKLRWLIRRQPTTLELRYYLVFLLIVHRRYADAAKECEQIRTMHPEHVMARVWLGRVERERCSVHRCDLSRGRKPSRRSPWRHTH